MAQAQAANPLAMVQALLGDIHEDEGLGHSEPKLKYAGMGKRPEELPMGETWWVRMAGEPRLVLPLSFKFELECGAPVFATWPKRGGPTATLFFSGPPCTCASSGTRSCSGARRRRSTRA